MTGDHRTSRAGAAGERVRPASAPAASGHAPADETGAAEGAKHGSGNAPAEGGGASRRGPDGESRPREIGGRDGPEPTRYGDWEKNGRCIDF